MWLLARFRPVGLFSLRMGEATSTGARTLLLPTPFTLRTALLDASIRVEGVGRAEEAFQRIRSLDLALRPPERVAVSHLWIRVWRPSRQEERVMDPTIAYREFAHLGGDLEVAFGAEEAVLRWVEGLLPHLTYFGKRGSFFQFVPPVRRQEGLPQGFVEMKGVGVQEGQVVGQPPGPFPMGVLQMVDDWGPDLTFPRLNTYAAQSMRMGRDRFRYGVVLPYRLVRASRAFSYYERLEGVSP